MDLIYSNLMTDICCCGQNWWSLQFFFPMLNFFAVEVYFELLILIVFKSHEPLFMHSPVSHWLLVVLFVYYLQTK